MGGEQDPIRAMATQMGELTGQLQVFAANQDKMNSRTVKVMDRLAEAQSSHGERISRCEVNADCVPDLYERNHAQDRKIAYAAGGLAVLIIVVQIVASFGRPIVDAIKG